MNSNNNRLKRLSTNYTSNMFEQLCYIMQSMITFVTWVLYVQLCNYSNNFCLMQSFFQNISQCDRENTSLYELSHIRIFYIKLFICSFLFKISFKANICFQWRFVVLEFVCSIEQLGFLLMTFEIKKINQ